MKANPYTSRWQDQDFLRASNEVLIKLFDDKRISENADLRGLAVGGEQGIAWHKLIHLVHAIIKSVDLRYASLSTNLHQSAFENVDFSSGSFDTCAMGSAVFNKCDFSDAKIRNPRLDDARFTSCTFAGTAFVGHGFQEYGGRRVTFENCCFKDAAFKNVQLRASTFKNCSFSAIAFHRCLLAGVKFQDAWPGHEAFSMCEITALRLNGEQIDVRSELNDELQKRFEKFARHKGWQIDRNDGK